MATYNFTANMPPVNEGSIVIPFITYGDVNCWAEIKLKDPTLVTDLKVGIRYSGSGKDNRLNIVGKFNTLPSNVIDFIKIYKSDGSYLTDGVIYSVAPPEHPNDLNLLCYYRYYSGNIWSYPKVGKSKLYKGLGNNTSIDILTEGTTYYEGYSSYQASNFDDNSTEYTWNNVTPPKPTTDIPVYFNETRLEKIVYNETEIEHLNFNGDTIY